MLAAFRFKRLGCGHGHSNRVCASHVARASGDFSPLCRALWRRCVYQELLVPRPVAGDGVCAAHAPRECATWSLHWVRARSCSTRWGFAVGCSAARWPTPTNIGIGGLCRLGAGADPACAQALRERTLAVELDQTVYAFDATVINLSLTFYRGLIFACANRRSNCTRSWTCAADRSRRFSL